MRVSNLATKCWHQLHKWIYCYQDYALVPEQLNGTSCTTVELIRRYEKIVNFLSRDPRQYFNEMEYPTIFPIQIIHRPLSTLFRCRVKTGTYNNLVYIKLLHVKKNSSNYHEKILQRIKKDVEITKNLHDIFNKNSIYAVPKTIAFFPGEMAIVTEESEGQPLLNLIRQKGKGYPSSSVVDALAQYCHAVGGWLKNFQQLTRVTTPQAWDESELINYVNLRLEKLEKSQLCIQPSDSHRIRYYLEQLLRQVALDKGTTCGVHGDLGLSNILVTSKKTTILDFPMYRIGNSYDDPAHICMRIGYMLYNPIYRKYMIREMKDAFLEGYQNEFDRKHPLFNAYYMKHKINRLVDLSKINGLSRIKKRYQIHQFQKYLNNINEKIQKLHMGDI